jgi:carboxylate-amine ligase
MDEPAFTVGIEEEYLLVDPETGALAEAPEALMADCAAALEGQVSPEFLRCQIEVGTRPHQTVAGAGEDLRHLRRTVAELAARHGLAPIAASCHPFSDWKEQHHTPKDRYDGLARDLAGVARRMLICGMHVHVGIEREDLRIDLMNQLTYFLPHFLALSCSSPFWQGADTGLCSYRLTIFDNLPRTGLPPQLSGWGEFERSVAALVELGLIEDGTKIWWDLRPSHRFPTLESRICDVSPRVEDTLTLAALIQATLRMLWRLSLRNQRWRTYDAFLIGENRWRAQRYGCAEGLIDFGRREIVPVPELIDELLHLIEEDAGWLRSTDACERARGMAAAGPSAVRQRAALERAKLAGASHEEALRAVVRHLAEEFTAGL